jgi:hypothetical protein
MQISYISEKKLTTLIENLKEFGLNPNQWEIGQWITPTQLLITNKLDKDFFEIVGTPDPQQPSSWSSLEIRS